MAVEREKVPMGAFAQVIEVLLRTESRQAIKYISEQLVVKATQKMSHKRRGPFLNQRSETLLVSFGKPNYREREFIKACKKAGEPFPVKRVQLRGFPGRPAAAA